MKRLLKRLTATRKRKIEDFKLLVEDNPNLFGTQGSRQWIQGLLKYLNEPGVLSLDNILDWLATQDIQEYFQTPPIRKRSLTIEIAPERINQYEKNTEPRTEARVLQEQADSDKAQEPLDEQPPKQEFITDDNPSLSFNEESQLSPAEVESALGNEDKDETGNEAESESDLEIVFEGPRITFNAGPGPKTEEIDIVAAAVRIKEEFSEPEMKKARKNPKYFSQTSDLSELVRIAAEISDELDTFTEPMQEPLVAKSLSTFKTSIGTYANIVFGIKPHTGNTKDKDERQEASGCEHKSNSGSKGIPSSPPKEKEVQGTLSHHSELPQPRHHSELPQPRHHSELPQPRHHSELPQPRHHSELPQPRHHSELRQPRHHSELPQPRHHSELRQPRHHSEPTPANSSTTLLSVKVEVADNHSDTSPPQDLPENPRAESPTNSLEEFILYAETTMNKATLCDSCAHRWTILRKLKYLLKSLEKLVLRLRRLNQPLFQELSVKTRDVEGTIYEFARRFRRKHESCRNCDTANTNRQQ